MGIGELSTLSTAPRAVGARRITGVVAALRAEARCLDTADRRGRQPRAADLLIRASGIGTERAARAAEELLHTGAEALLCVGVGGALDPSLRCGDVVLAHQILRAVGPPLQGCAHWLAQLEASLSGHARVRAGALLTSDEIVGSVQHKHELFVATGAVAVDMESAAVAQVAARAAVPFLALRVIADTAADALPPILQQLLAARSQRAAPGCYWWPLLRRPTSWSALPRLARRYRLALRVLSRCARAGLACPLAPAGPAAASHTAAARPP